MNELLLESPTSIVEDSIIVLALSLSLTYCVFTVLEYYKPKVLVDLGNAVWLQ